MKKMQVRLDEALWSTAVDPLGLLEQWFRQDGERVLTGDKLAEVLIEGARHDIIAEGDGELRILARKDAAVDPGAVIAEIV